MNRSTKIEELNLVLSRPPLNLGLKVETEVEDNNSTKYLQMIWLSLLRRLMDTVGEEMRETQARYKWKFSTQVKEPKGKVNMDYRVFLRKEYHFKSDPNHKLTPIATGPYDVTDVN